MSCVCLCDVAGFMVSNPERSRGGDVSGWPVRDCRDGRQFRSLSFHGERADGWCHEDQSRRLSGVCVCVWDFLEEIFSTRIFSIS